MTELKKSKEKETTEEEKRRQKMNIVQFYLRYLLLICIIQACWLKREHDFYRNPIS